MELNTQPVGDVSAAETHRFIHWRRFDCGSTVMQLKYFVFDANVPNMLSPMNLPLYIAIIYYNYM